MSLDHRARRGALHHGIVDGVRRAGRERSRIQPQKIEVALARLPRRLCCSQNVGAEALKFLEKALGLEREHAAVPEKPVARNIPPRRLQVGLLDETLDPVAVLAPGYGLAALDITVPGDGSARRDSESDERT